MFSFILGVTGTLKNLSEPERVIVRNQYNISKETFMPSIFGKNNLKFNMNSEDVFVENSNEYYMRISSEIQKASNRAIISLSLLAALEGEQILFQGMTKSIITGE